MVTDLSEAPVHAGRLVVRRRSKSPNKGPRPCHRRKKPEERQRQLNFDRKRRIAQDSV